SMDRPEPEPFEQVRNRLFLRGNLSQFYRSLESLESARSPGDSAEYGEDTPNVRILFFGDSVIWGDCLTVRLKRKFQERFGDGGRGLLRFIDWAPTRLMDHTNLTRGGFERHKIPFESFDVPPFPHLGFTGFSHRPQNDRATTIQQIGPRTPIYDVRRYQSIQKNNPSLPAIPETGAPAGAKYGTDGESWKRVQLIVRPGESREIKAQLSYRMEDGATGHDAASLRFVDSGCQSISFSIPASRRIDLSFEGRPYIDGLAVETGGGVSFSSIVMRGLHQAWLLGIPEEQFACGYRQYDPDLVIFQFGINESQTMHYAVQGFSPEIYENQLRQLYARIQRAAPRASILILGPWERLLKQNGVYQTYEAHARVREIQKRVANDMGLAYFDGFIFLEGTEGLRRAVRRGLIQGDYTHTSYPGGHYMADALYAKLMEDFQTWKESRR
ncbi:MAG: hypothetical protein KDK25_08755, partial [Leptospiraceae bacterium]|nr:hypothetical protein [Leptospiraceae bacterium]